jgi:hypothetical protein
MKSPNDPEQRLAAGVHSQNLSRVLVYGDDAARKNDAIGEIRGVRRKLRYHRLSGILAGHRIPGFDQGKDPVAGLYIGNVTVEQPIELRFKGEDASRCAEDTDERARNQGNRQVKIENQPAHASILCAIEQTSYSRPTPSESATRLM